MKLPIVFKGRMLMLFQFLLVTVVMVANAQADKGGSEDNVAIDYFYINDRTVMEFMDDGGVKKNWFMNQSGPRVVEFYSPLCPACNEFRPNYIRLAEDTVERFPSIRFYGVSCDKYEKLCDQYGVEDFPTIKLFPINEPDPRSKGILLEKHSKLSPKRLATQLKVLPKSSDEDEDKTDDPEDEQDIKPERVTDMPLDDVKDISNTHMPQRDEFSSPEEDEDEDLDDSEDPTTLDDPEDEPLPDFRTPQTDMIPLNQQFSPPVKGGRPNAGHMMANMGNKQMDRYSSILVNEKDKYVAKRKGLGGTFRKDNTRDKHGQPLPPATMEDTTRSMRQFSPGTLEFQERQKALLDRVKSKKKRRGKIMDEPLVLKKETLPFHKDVRKPTFTKKVAEHIPIVKRMVKMTEEEELILDACLSLIIALETGVSMGIEELESRTAMRKWLDLVAVSLPPEWAIHKMIDGIRNQFMYATKSKDNFRELLRQHVLPRKGWSHSCSSKSFPTGFSCGMWKLLHIITVGVVEQKGGRNLIESGMIAPSSNTFSPMEAADTIRNFLQHFFTCRPCRENFIENYDDCENNRRCDRLAFKDDLDAIAPSDWKELPLWLWEVHNEVSVRLVHERAKKDFDMKGVRKLVMPKDEVKVIWPNVETCILCFNEDGTWNEGQVFRYLERVYWPESEVDPKHDQLLTFDDDGTRSFGFLWLMTFLIVLVIYKTIGKQSRSIQSSVLVAKQLVARSAGASMGMAKKRTA
jgi:thiol-disulfide isomerase/thioredoxin